MGPIIILILVGLVFLFVETLLTPGIAVSGILGILCLVASCYFGFQTYGYVAGLAIVLLNVLIAGGFIIFVLRSKTWKKATLNTSIDAVVDTMPSQKGLKEGDEGITTTRLNPMGRADFNGIEVEVRSTDGLIEARSKVIIHSISGERIFVSKIN